MYTFKKGTGQSSAISSQSSETVFVSSSSFIKLFTTERNSSSLYGSFGLPRPFLCGSGVLKFILKGVCLSSSEVYTASLMIECIRGMKVTDRMDSTEDKVAQRSFLSSHTTLKIFKQSFVPTGYAFRLSIERPLTESPHSTQCLAKSK